MTHKLIFITFTGKLFKRQIGGAIIKPREIKTNLIDLMRVKCEQNAPKNGFATFTIGFQNTTDCFQIYAKKYPDFDNPPSDYNAQWRKCVNYFVNGTTPCLREVEKYWPQFSFDIFLSLLDFFYTNKRELLSISRTLFYSIGKLIFN